MPSIATVGPGSRVLDRATRLLDRGFWALIAAAAALGLVGAAGLLSGWFDGARLMTAAGYLALGALAMSLADRVVHGLQRRAGHRVR